MYTNVQLFFSCEFLKENCEEIRWCQVLYALSVGNILHKNCSKTMRIYYWSIIKTFQSNRKLNIELIFTNETIEFKSLTPFAQTHFRINNKTEHHSFNWDNMNWMKREIHLYKYSSTLFTIFASLPEPALLLPLNTRSYYVCYSTNTKYTPNKSKFRRATRKYEKSKAKIELKKRKQTSPTRNAKNDSQNQTTNEIINKTVYSKFDGTITIQNM